MKSPCLVMMVSALTVTALAEENPATPWRSALYPEDWKPGFADGQGRFLHDFSYAGYQFGEEPLPVVEGPVRDVTMAPYLADKTGKLDATAAIQSALDEAAKSGGGVVFLPAGIYRIAPPEGRKEALWIKGDYVVLRGEGANKSFLFNDQSQMAGKTVLRVEAENRADWHAEGAGIPVSPLTRDGENQSREIFVEDPGLFSRGDLVIVRGDLTQRFIDSVGMKDKWQPAGAASPNRTLMFCRRVVEVDVPAKRLVLDVPLRYPVLVADQARVVKIPGRLITGVGLEDFALGMKQCPGEGVAEEDWNKEGTIGKAVHGAQGIRLEGAENCWLKNLRTYAPEGNDPRVHVLSNMLTLSRSRLVTVDSCDFKFAQYKGGGGNGYLFALQGQENLIIRCTAEGGRHNYDFGTMRCSGNVLTQCLAKDGQLGSDFHMFLSMSNLLDSMTCDGDFLEARDYRPWGGNPIHGVTTTQSVFWNTKGLRYSQEKVMGRSVLIRSQQVGDGYVIGTQGPCHEVFSDDFVEGIGRGEGLWPQSLYADQLERRMKAGGR
jgi:hypothetical protein